MMTTTRPSRIAAVLLTAALGLSGCGTDDGAEVREIGPTDGGSVSGSATGTGSGSATGTGSGSATGSTPAAETEGDDADR